MEGFMTKRKLTDKERQERLDFLLSRDGIGGSHAAMILGVSEYGTPRTAYDEIVGAMDQTLTLDDIDDEVSVDLDRGNMLESVAIQQYRFATGREGRRQSLTRRHPDHPEIIAHIDWQIFSEGNGHGTGVLEVYCPRLTKVVEIKAHGLSRSKVCQLQHYLAVFGYKWGSYDVFHPDLGVGYFDMERNTEWINEVWLPAMIRFKQEHLIPRVPPEDEAIEPAEMPEVQSGEVITVDSPAWQEAVEAVREAYEMEAVASMLKEMRVADAASIIEQFEVEVIEGAGLRAYYRASSPRRTLDKAKIEKFLDEHGEKIDDYYKLGKPGKKSFRAYDTATGKALATVAKLKAEERLTPLLPV